MAFCKMAVGVTTGRGTESLYVGQVLPPLQANTGASASRTGRPEASSLEKLSFLFKVAIKLSNYESETWLL